MTDVARLEWLRDRQTGIGGSDVAAIMGCDPFGKTPADVYDSKTQPINDDGQEDMTTPQRRGVVLEPIAADEYVRLTGRKLRRWPMKRHPKYPFMVGNIDRQQLGVGEMEGYGPGALEIKCPGLAQFAKMMYHGLDVAKLLQVMHYLEVFGYNWGTFAIFNAEYMTTLWFDVVRDQEWADKLSGGGERPVYVVDPELRDQMIEAEVRFWGMVERGERPETPLAQVAAPESQSSVFMRDDPEWETAVGSFAQAVDLEETAKSVKKDATETIQGMCDKYGVYEGGGYRVHYKQTPGKRRFDKAALEAARPIDADKLQKFLADEHNVTLVPGNLEYDLVLNLDDFYATGDPGLYFRVFPIKRDFEEE